MKACAEHTMGLERAGTETLQAIVASPDRVRGLGPHAAAVRFRVLVHGEHGLELVCSGWIGSRIELATGTMRIELPLVGLSLECAGFDEPIALTTLPTWLQASRARWPTGGFWYAEARIGSGELVTLHGSAGMGRLVHHGAVTSLRTESLVIGL